jgi:hypothetical protein
MIETNLRRKILELIREHTISEEDKALLADYYQNSTGLA